MAKKCGCKGKGKTKKKINDYGKKNWQSKAYDS